MLFVAYILDINSLKIYCVYILWIKYLFLHIFLMNKILYVFMFTLFFVVWCTINTKWNSSDSSQTEQEAVIETQSETNSETTTEIDPENNEQPAVWDQENPAAKVLDVTLMIVSKPIMSQPFNVSIIQKEVITLNDTAWVGIVPVWTPRNESDADAVDLSYQYITSNQDYELYAPQDAWIYEMRIYGADDWDEREELFSRPFIVYNADWSMPDVDKEILDQVKDQKIIWFGEKK